jgi:uncharacterized membrane protein YgcG
MSSASDGAPAATHGGNNNNNNNNNNEPREGGRQRNRNRNKERVRTANRFEGEIDGLKGHVYDVGASRNSAEDFHRTTTKIAEYISRMEDGAGEFLLALDPNKLKFEALIKPVLPDETAANFEELKYEWGLDVKDYRQRLKTRTQLIMKAFAIVLGQCSQAVRDRIEAHQDWNATKTSLDVIKLLILIRTSLFSGATTRHAVHAIMDAQDAFMSLRQGKMDNGEYYDRFKHLLDVYEHLGGDVGVMLKPPSQYIRAADPDEPTEDEIEAARAAARDAYLAIRFLRRADLNRYGTLLADIENEHTRGIGAYPTTLVKAYDLLVNYVNPNRHSHSSESQGMSFYQEGDTESGRGYSGSRGRGGGRGRGRGNSGGRGTSGRGTSQSTSGGNASPPVDAPNSNNESVAPYSTTVSPRSSITINK